MLGCVDCRDCRRRAYEDRRYHSAIAHTAASDPALRVHGVGRLEDVEMCQQLDTRPARSIVVYDPDSGLVVDLIAGEDAHQSERTLAVPVLEHARPGQLWTADRHVCIRTLLAGWEAAGRISLCVSTPTPPPEPPGRATRLWPHGARRGPRAGDHARRQRRRLALR